MDPFSKMAEGLERATLEDLHAAASPEVRGNLGLNRKEIDGVLVSLATRDPSLLLNRAVGFGVEKPARPETVQKICRCYAAAGIENFYFHFHPEITPPGARSWLSRQGLVPARGWVKFRRGVDPPPEVNSRLQVRRIDSEHAEPLGRILAQGFGLTEKAVPLLASLVGRPRWTAYMSFSGADPAGTGLLYVGDQIGWLDWASTHPHHRRKGGQGAVLARRIRDAAGLGCRTLLTTTGEAVEGDPQHSYRNILRMGFEIAYTRENYVPAKSRG